MLKPEAHARESIDEALRLAGWILQDAAEANVDAGPGVAVREFPLGKKYGFADYLLYVNSKAAGVIEAKKVGASLTGVELQTGRYSEGLPKSLPAWLRPLPFLYESTGVETRFTNRLDPDPRSRSVFTFTARRHSRSGSRPSLCCCPYSMGSRTPEASFPLHFRVASKLSSPTRRSARSRASTW